MGDSKAMAHVLVIAYTTEGHVNPLLRLAIQLARKGTTITFFGPEDAISRFTSGDTEGLSSELHSLDFRFVGLPLPEGLNNARPQIITNRVREAFQPFMEQLVHEKSSDNAGGPTSMISDMFLAWAQDVADKLQIPGYMFISSGVIFARFIQGCLPYYERGQFQASEADGRLVPFDWPVCVPGLPSLRYHELIGFLKYLPVEFRARCESVGQSAGILVNSFFELEEKVIETWKSVGNPGFEHIKVPKIYTVGPLFSTSATTVKAPPRGLESSTSSCLLWLGSQPSSSVVYVAFGSQFRLSPEQIHELALGLEDSKQRFLWVIPAMKKGGSEKETLTISSTVDVLQAGFEARVGNRGCIVTGWAPQLQILAHSSTGGFFTHCGWNSSLESIIWGVPMISWPQGAEQHLNCRYLVDDLKIAEQIQTGSENILKRGEVERVVRRVMEESEGRAIRSRVEELQRKAAAAMAEGGSRSRFVQEFLDDVEK